MQGKGHDEQEANPSLSELMSWRPMFFLRNFLCFVLPLLLHHIGELATPRDHLFLLPQFLHLVLFEPLQQKGELSITVDSRIVLWWARDSNHVYRF